MVKLGSKTDLQFSPPSQLSLGPRGGDEQERCDPSGGHWTSVFSYLSQSSHSLNFEIMGN